MSDQAIKVHGIRELNAAFGKVSADLKPELKGRFLDVATNVAGKARGKVPHRTGRAAGSIKSRASARGASIAFGGTAAPYMPWLDFGGSVGRGHRPGVPWSGAIKRAWKGKPGGEGRYVYPAISEARPETEKAVDAAIEAVARRAGFDTRG